VGRVLFLTDRSPGEALPSLSSLGLDVKSEPLTADALADLTTLSPSAVLVDAAGNPAHAFGLLERFEEAGARVPVVVVVARDDVERYPWERVADELLHPGTPAPELRVRLAMLARRTGGAGDALVLLGPLAINTETYQVTVAGRILDLTYKEFQLLRFLVERPSRVFTRTELLRQVWGYDFYGGTRTVDVHVRRLRAKLGVEHEGLVQTVRGVGYRAAEPRSAED
jgi:DNA-binding response OmpR family regulator